VTKEVVGAEADGNKAEQRADAHSASGISKEGVVKAESGRGHGVIPVADYQSSTKSDCARSGTTGRGDGGSVGHVDGVVGAAGGHGDECLRAARERVGRFGRLGSIRGTSDGSRGGGCSDFFVRIERAAAKEIVGLVDVVDDVGSA
jgi:hypothetical protein